MTLTRENLERMTCAHDGHEPEACDNSTLYFHGACHPQSPTWTFYEDGTLTVECAECRSEIARVRVASMHNQSPWS